MNEPLHIRKHRHEIEVWELSEAINARRQDLMRECAQIPRLRDIMERIDEMDESLSRLKASEPK